MKKLIFTAFYVLLFFANLAVADGSSFKFKAKSEKSDNLLVGIYDYFSDRNLEKKYSNFF